MSTNSMSHSVFKQKSKEQSMVYVSIYQFQHSNLEIFKGKIKNPRKIDCTFHPAYDQGSHLMTPSNVTSAIAFTGNALKKHGVKPLQKPLIPALPSR